jgi:hypothetical protein
MRNRRLRSLALSLGWLAAGAAAAILSPLLRAETPGPVIQPWPPVAPAAAPAPEAAPAATLDRPVPLRDSRPVEDSEVQPTGLFNNRGGEPGNIYGPFTGLNAPRPLPPGPSVDVGPSPLPPGSYPTNAAPDVPYTWKQAPAPAPVTSQPAAPPAGSTMVMPAPSPGTVVTPAPPPGAVPVGPGIVGAPIGDPICDGCGVPGCCAPNCCCDGACCGSTCCDGCGWGWGCWNRGCCFPNRWYGTAEYLLWFIRGQPLPPLLTTGPITDNPPGAFGQPGTMVLDGNNSVSNNPLSGVRLRGGYWFGDCHGLGLDLGGFILGGGNNRFSTSSLGNPFLARPFINALTGLPDIEAVATPNGLTGSYTRTAPIFLFGAEANLRRNICCGCNWFIDGLAGWRLLGLNESLNIMENLAVVSSTNPALPAGSTFQVADHFVTRNLFNGGQIGGIFEYRLGRWSADLRSTVALGGTSQFVSISGSTRSQAPGQPPIASVGGLLAQTSNIGHFNREIITVVPEVGINVGYQFTNHLRAFVGYNFLYWSNVVRPGNQIDLVVNPNLIPPSTPGGPQRPTFNFHGSDFWVQGIQFGIDFRW